MLGAFWWTVEAIQESGLMDGMNIFTVRDDMKGIRRISKKSRQLLIQKEAVCVCCVIQTV
jgi:hypothetical protein